MIDIVDAMKHYISVYPDAPPAITMGKAITEIETLRVALRWMTTNYASLPLFVDEPAVQAELVRIGKLSRGEHD